MGVLGNLHVSTSMILETKAATLESVSIIQINIPKQQECRKSLVRSRWAASAEPVAAAPAVVAWLPQPEERNELELELEQGLKKKSDRIRWSGWKLLQNHVHHEPCSIERVRVGMS
eukprot:TRINITY_DN858_c0_g1_i2.p1 TRINITY_DN858_c0_g1~~TRINITY_DN858_c0_g1_i2.p1  ORF type:complete len:116 (+),score=11.58 TRINITY_DN858_c0_g1_i2:112-459(+)